MDDFETIWFDLVPASPEDPGALLEHRPLFDGDEEVRPIWRAGTRLERYIERALEHEASMVAPKMSCYRSTGNGAWEISMTGLPRACAFARNMIGDGIELRDEIVLGQAPPWDLVFYGDAPAAFTWHVVRSINSR